MQPSVDNPTPYVYDSNQSFKSGFPFRKILSYVIILASLIFIIVIGLSIYDHYHSPQVIGQNFANQILSGQATKSYQDGSSDFKSSTNLQSWTADVNTADNICIGKTSFVSNSIRATTDRLILKANGPNNSVCNIEVDLVLVSGSWQPDSFLAY